MKTRLLRLLREETVLCAAFALAAVSMLLVPPDAGYLGYVDFQTLAILFCLMGVLAGLQRTGIFQWIARTLLGRVQKTWQLALILVLLCFFSSMLLTNDVALITFVPFAFVVLGMAGPQVKQQLAIPLVALQTIAANLGSMLTPMGNPQNLYLYGRSGLSLGSFVLLMLPYTLASLAVILLWTAAQARVHRTPIRLSFQGETRFPAAVLPLCVYGVLFVLSLLAVARVVPYGLSLGLTVLGLLAVDRRAFAGVDYGLLLTFVGFFIFTGNMGRLPAFSQLLQQVVAGNEVAVGVAASQVISNVPAALLLSGFTTNYAALTVGVNLGGLGTLIASMASLISYKLLAREDSGAAGPYLRYFTLANLLFLAVLLAVAWVCGA